VVGGEALVDEVAQVLPDRLTPVPIGVWGASERKTYVRVGAGAAVSLSWNLQVPQHRQRTKRDEHFPCRRSVLQKSAVPIQFCITSPDCSRPMLLGYARVSTDDQDLALQRKALREAGCRRTYAEKVSGARRDRPELEKLLDNVRKEDVVVVTRLDRLARSTRDLLDIAERLRDADAELRSLAEPWADTTSPAGRMVLTVFAGIAEFERTLILGRTSAGREAAKQRGVRFGRPPALTPDQVALGRRLVNEGTSVRAAAKVLRCHHATLYRALDAAGSQTVEAR